MIFRFYFTLVIILINLSLFYCDDEKLQINYKKKKSTVMIAILVRNKEHTLPYFLTCLERLNYPKDRISLWITSDNNIDKSTEVLRAWLEENGRYYHGYKAVLDEDSDGFPGETGVADWTIERYQHIIQLREAALKAAKAQWADYLWMLDADTFITNPNTLSELISKGYPLVAPMLLSDGLYSNFWGGMTEQFYYRRTDEYLEILNRRKMGCFNVPMIHSAVLIDLKLSKSEQLTYDPNEVPDYSGPQDDIIAFAIASTRADIPLMVCNDKVYGFIMSVLEKQDDLLFDLEQLRNVKLEVLNFGPGLNTTDLMAKWVKTPLPPSDELNLHRTYLISLERRRERRDRMSSCLEELSIPASIFEGIDGKHISYNSLDLLGINMLPIYEDPYHKRPMKKGEIGCFLSHYNIWKEVLEEQPDQPVMVLEDDIRFEPFFRQKLISILKEAERLPFTWDIIYLGRKKMHEDEEEEVGSLGILVRAGYSYWTIGYLLSYQGAQKLVAANPLDNLVPVDEFIPILSDQHPRWDWKEYFDEPRDLNVLSSKPLLLYPVLYSNEEGYTSDTEDSALATEDPLHDEL